MCGFFNAIGGFACCPHGSEVDTILKICILISCSVLNLLQQVILHILRILVHTDILMQVNVGLQPATPTQNYHLYIHPLRRIC